MTQVAECCTPSTSLSIHGAGNTVSKHTACFAIWWSVNSGFVKYYCKSSTLNAMSLFLICELERSIFWSLFQSTRLYRKSKAPGHLMVCNWNYQDSHAMTHFEIYELEWPDDSWQVQYEIQMTISSLAPVLGLMLTLFLAAQSRRAASTAIIIRASHPATEPVHGQSSQICSTCFLLS